MIRRSIWMLFALTLLVPAAAADAREIRIGVSGEMAPFVYRNEAGWQGMSVEVARTVLEDLGHTVASIDSFPMARLAVMFERGEIDLQPNLSPTPERLKVAIFTTVPHIFEPHSFIARRDVAVPYDGSMGSLQGIRIATMRGWTHGDAFDADATLRKTFVKSITAQVRMLANGRVKLAVQNPAAFFFQARLEGIDAGVFRVLEPPSVNLPVFMALSKALDGATELRDSLDRALARFIRSDAYRVLKKKHGF